MKTSLFLFLNYFQPLEDKLSPPTFIISDFLPIILMYSPSTSTLSPVLNQPSSVKGLEHLNNQAWMI